MDMTKSYKQMRKEKDAAAAKQRAARRQAFKKRCAQELREGIAAIRQKHRDAVQAEIKALKEEHSRKVNEAQRLKTW